MTAIKEMQSAKFVAVPRISRLFALNSVQTTARARTAGDDFSLNSNFPAKLFHEIEHDGIALFAPAFVISSLIEFDTVQLKGISIMSH